MEEVAPHAEAPERNTQEVPTNGDTVPPQSPRTPDYHTNTESVTDSSNVFRFKQEEQIEMCEENIENISGQALEVIQLSSPSHVLIQATSEMLPLEQEETFIVTTIEDIDEVIQTQVVIEVGEGAQSTGESIIETMQISEELNTETPESVNDSSLELDISVSVETNEIIKCENIAVQVSANEQIQVPENDLRSSSEMEQSSVVEEEQASIAENEQPPIAENEHPPERSPTREKPSVTQKPESVKKTIKREVPASEAVPLITESILSALSEIHGEMSPNVTNGVSSSLNNSYIELTPEALARAATENVLFRKRKNVIRSVNKRGTPALNDRQLLAILEDKTLEPSPSPVSESCQSMKKRRNQIDVNVERQIVLKQLREFPRKRKNKTPSVEKIEDVKIPKVDKKKNVDPKMPTTPVKTSTPSYTDVSSIINDWTDDETAPSTPLTSHQNNDSVSATPQSDVTALTTDSNAENTKASTNGESFVKPKRVARIIKKKIIYDPDNPETFKFASDIVQAAVTCAELKQLKSAADTKQHKTQTTTNEKHNKTLSSDGNLVNTSSGNIQSKTMGPSENKVIKVNTPETKQNKSPSDSKITTKIGGKKRLTEVDKLLMDEGAVNMLYQMEQSNNDGEAVPQEQSKKKKTISNEKKMKIIKKAVINHSKTNINQPAKVFRVRKDKTDTSINSKMAANAAARATMQSPSLSEMSAVSVNESRIIRRHSSSSFSSGCLSPRPLSPAGDTTKKSLNSTTDSGIHNKVVKKKPGRQKKVSKSLDNTESSFISPITPVPDVATLQMNSFSQLLMDISDNMTHIIVNPTGNCEELYDYQVITELTAAVRLCGSASAVLLSSSQGALCGGLDLRGLLQPTVEQQKHHAEQLLDAFRELMVALCECRPALVCCIGGACTGPGIALLTLCDLALASDRATFCVAPRLRRKLPPEGAALLTRPYALPPQISRELVLCGRKLTASEALQRGIVSRTLWPDRFIEEVKSIVKDLAQHPPESFSIMKNVLRRGEVTAVTSALRHEGRLLLDYWCSPQGQEAIKEVHANLSC